MRAWWFLLALTGLCCVSGAQIRASSEVIKADLERARRSGALRCAPKELATAEANLEFALGELDEGDSNRADQHIRDAETSTKKALALSKACAPLTVRVNETPVVVKVTDPDRDGDGIPDAVDRCIDQPEDFDGFQDEDGCPDPDNDNDGLLDAADKCPNQAGPIQNFGCPIIDTDGDGIPDDKDKCPNEMGPAENDGCPDKDTDGDGIVDRLDKCPNEPGPKEEQGCPKKYQLVVVTAEKIEIKKQIKFATGSAQIVGSESKQILSEVAQALGDTPRIKKIRIEGHTDSVGNDSANLKLSQNRADAVMSALIKLGVDPGRMEAVGFGETKPIASNSTASGRAENRRTEFNIIEQ